LSPDRAYPSGTFCSAWLYPYKLDLPEKQPDSYSLAYFDAEENKFYNVDTRLSGYGKKLGQFISSFLQMLNFFSLNVVKTLFDIV
jgi:hypothetical protein